NFRRTATVDTVLAGQEIKAGARVVMWHMSGNRDEAVFDRPYEFDIERDPNLHLQQIAFGGGGPHFCLGANLARAEMKIMISEVLRVLPDMELAGPVDRLRSNFINGIKRMPVRVGPLGRSVRPDGRAAHAAVSPTRRPSCPALPASDRSGLGARR
ncbi:MAG: cytochrome P450, partial [Acidimicrobiales bacterium]